MNRKPIFDAVKAERGGKAFTGAEVVLLDRALDGLGFPVGAMPPPAPASTEPPWIAAARTKLGEKEIPGPQHNSWIAKGWAKLGASWFNDDETPWCGFFVAWAMNEAGFPYPAGGVFARAKSWATYGEPIAACYGAIGVKSRTGGGHVFFIVGESADRQFYKALGGNQSNMVSIMDVRKTDLDAVRWPTNAGGAGRALPILPRGTLLTNMA